MTKCLTKQTKKTGATHVTSVQRKTLKFKINVTNF